MESESYDGKPTNGEGGKSPGKQTRSRTSFCVGQRLEGAYSGRPGGGRDERHDYLGVVGGKIKIQ